MTSESHASGHRARLREKVFHYGAHTLTDYEVLEAMLFSAKPRGDVKPIAKALLKKFGSLAKLANASAAEITEVEGAGESVYTTLKIAKNFAERLARDEIKKAPILDSWLAVLDYCKIALKNSKIEEFRVLYINSANILLRDEILYTGTVDQTAAYPREILKKAMDSGASSIMLIHNHPSGSATPSKSDIELTKQIVSASNSLGIKVLDHIIIAENGHCSFKAQGLI